MDTFSFSRLNTYETCPRRFYYKYVLGWEDPAGLPAIFGKTVHKAVEFCLNGHSFNDAVATAWIEEGNMDPGVDKAEVERQVNRALRLGFTGEVERHFVMELAPGIKLQGYIDLVVDGHIPIIIDWKTGRKTNGVLANWQIPLYSAHVMESGYNRVLGMLAFLRFNRIFKDILTPEIAQKAKNWAIGLAREIQHKLDLLPLLTETEILFKAFPDQTSWLCGYCPWSYDCLVTRESLKIAI